MRGGEGRTLQILFRRLGCIDLFDVYKRKSVQIALVKPGKEDCLQGGTGLLGCVRDYREGIL